MTTGERDPGPRHPPPAGRPGGRRSVATLLTYAVPLAGASYLLFFVQFYFLKFATDELLLAPAAVGLLFGLAKVWDAVSDPLVGHWSDRTRSRLGRRRPWMWAALPPLGACFALLWMPPAVSGSALLIWEGGMLLGLYTALTLYLVPHASLGASLTTDARQRTRLFGLRHVFWTLGLFAAFAAIQEVAGSAVPRLAAARVALGTAVVAVALLAVTPAAVREPLADRGGGRTLRRALRDVRDNPHARLLLAVWFVESLGAGVVGVLAPYIAEYVLVRPDLMGAIPAIYVAAAVLAVPFWVYLAGRCGRKPTWLTAMIVTAVAFGGVIAVGEGDVALLCTLMAVAGAGMGCGGAVGAATLTDVIDDDERRTGARQEGVYSAAWGFVLKLAVGLVTAGVGIALQAVGFVPNQTQDPLVTWTLRGLFAGVPCLAFALGAALFRRFALPESAATSDWPTAPAPLERPRPEPPASPGPASPGPASRWRSNRPGTGA